MLTERVSTMLATEKVRLVLEYGPRTTRDVADTLQAVRNFPSVPYSTVASTINHLRRRGEVMRINTKRPSIWALTGKQGARPHQEQNA